MAQGTQREREQKESVGTGRFRHHSRLEALEGGTRFLFAGLKSNVCV